MQVSPEMASVGLLASEVADDQRYLAIAGFCAVHKVFCQWFDDDGETFVVIGAFGIDGDDDHGEGDELPPDVKEAAENPPVNFDMLINEAPTRH